MLTIQEQPSTTPHLKVHGLYVISLQPSQHSIHPSRSRIEMGHTYSQMTSFESRRYRPIVAFLHFLYIGPSLSRRSAERMSQYYCRRENEWLWDVSWRWSTPWIITRFTTSTAKFGWMTFVPGSKQMQSKFVGSFLTNLTTVSVMQFCHCSGKVWWLARLINLQ